MKKKITVVMIPLFFIIPWAAYLLSLLDLRSKKSAFIYIFSAAFFGYAISFSDPSADSYRYAAAFINFDRPDSYWAIIQMYLDGLLRDIYRISLFYFTSFFSKSPHAVYVLAGFIYGLITYLNLRICINERGKQTDRYTLILALIFITFFSLSNINSFRYNTGAMLAFYSIYKLVIENKKFWIIGILITPLIHYSLVILIPVILILKLIIPFTYDSVKVKPILFYIFIITFILSQVLDTNSINVGFISRLDVLPTAVSDRVDYINSDDVTEIIESRANNSLFVAVGLYFKYMISMYVLIAIIYIRRLIKSSSGNLKEVNLLFSFVMLYYSFAHIASTLPSGGRYMQIGHVFLFILICRLYKIYKTKEIKKLIVISLVPFSFQIIFINIMLPIMILSPVFWYGGFIGVLLENLGSIRG